jgi:subtilase family serine protease
VSESSQRYSLTLDAAAAEPSIAQPKFHLAQVILEEPADTDRSEPMSSANQEPLRAALNPALAQLSSKRLTRAVMDQMLETGTAPEASLSKGTEIDPFASTSTATVYTPAQIRTAYGLPTLPGGTASITSAQAAQLGAGQTIYLIDADNDPNAAAELASFDSKFGLPGCTVTPIAPTASLPLTPAPLTGCVFSVVYINTNGVMTATAPVYNSGWATEIAIDVQWAHATAPYARIVLIEAPDASTVSLTDAVQLANQMGPGVVSQSFGSAEGGWTSVFDAAFSVANMTYLAATGDAGAEVDWPAVSSHVLAVSGTSLAYSGTGSRTETVWSGTGGGVSAYVPKPTYQALAVPGINASGYRGVSDVTFNADPNTGQYLAIMPQGSTSVGWYSAGGTSLATPQWAGIIAIANAVRAQNSIAPIGAAQTALYGLATQSTSYASDFLDVKSGSDGTCTTCYAGVGYDLPSGLGSPNVATLLTALNGQPPTTAPVVTAASVSGTVASALSFSISATGTHALTYSLTGAPSGMAVNANTGLVTWGTPALGTYSVVAHAADASTGLSGQATISVRIVGVQPPQVAGGSITGVAQTALIFSAPVVDSNAVKYSLSGAPSGMVINTVGVISWASPIAGSYSVTVSAFDATTGLTGQGVYTVAIAAPPAPIVPPATIAAMVGRALSFVVNATDANPLTYSMTGAPAGMTIAGTTGLVSWSNPTLGSFPVTIKAFDAKTGLTGVGLYTVSIIQSGPVIAATSLTGVAGKAFTGSIGFSDSASTSLSIWVGGVPTGMSFTASGSALAAKWANPVTGVYSLHVTVIDGKGLTGTATVPLTITAH